MTRSKSKPVTYGSSFWSVMVIVLAIAIMAFVSSFPVIVTVASDLNMPASITIPFVIDGMIIAAAISRLYAEMIGNQSLKRQAITFSIIGMMTSLFFANYHSITHADDTMTQFDIIASCIMHSVPLIFLEMSLHLAGTMIRPETDSVSRSKNDSVSLPKNDSVSRSKNDSVSLPKADSVSPVRLSPSKTVTGDMTGYQNRTVSSGTVSRIEHDTDIGDIEQAREFVSLSSHQDKTVTDIAEIWGVSPATVNRKIKKMRENDLIHKPEGDKKWRLKSQLA